jgi:hypothetical protein
VNPNMEDTHSRFNPISATSTDLNKSIEVACPESLAFDLLIPSRVSWYVANTAHPVKNIKRAST